MSIAPERRFSPSRPCPVCGGHYQLPRGNGERCYGFLADDGVWAHCTRDEHAGGLEQNPESGTYAHRLKGDCRCGVRHDTGPADVVGHEAPQKTKIEKAYDYRSAEGNSVFQVVRFDPKDFRQRRPDGRGGFTWSLNGVERVLYRLPELPNADPSETVFVSEGEKDADRLAGLGLVTTTNPGGARKWRDGYTAALKRRRVAILQDNDEEGRKHVEKIARALYGRAASVKVSDWLDAGNAVEELLGIVDATPHWEPSSSPADAPEHLDDVGTLLSDMVEEPVEWLWEGRIPLGKLTVIGGDPGTGKSALTADLAARVSTGREMPNPKEANER